MVEQAVENGGGNDGVPEDLAPGPEALIAGEDDRAALVAARHKLKAEIGALAVDGDVADLVVADMLFHAYPDSDEGQKSKIKASVVSTQALARRAEEMQLGRHLLLGRGEEKTGGRFKQALLADAYEALIAAVYLDGGLPAAAAFLERELSDAIEEGAGQTVVGQDYKSALQERVQAQGRPLPEYRVAAESGPEHRKVFIVEVVVSGETLASAAGKAKKAAEQEAARLALLQLESKK